MSSILDMMPGKNVKVLKKIKIDDKQMIWTEAIINSMNKGENIIITPHVGGMTIEGQTKAYTWAINKL